MLLLGRKVNDSFEDRMVEIACPQGRRIRDWQHFRLVAAYCSQTHSRAQLSVHT